MRPCFLGTKIRKHETDQKEDLFLREHCVGRPKLKKSDPGEPQIFENVPKCAANFRKRPKMCRKFSKMSQNVPQIFENVPKCAASEKG